MITALKLLYRLATLLLLVTVQPVLAWSPHRQYDEGWEGTVDFGAQQISGNSRSSSVSSALELRYVRGRFECELTGELLFTRASIVKSQRDDTGAVQLDDDGLPVLEVVTGRSNERIAGGVQLRWFWRPRLYQFAQLEQERDKPANILYRTRRTTGAGYLIWRSKDDYLAAELGLGDKQLDYVDEEPTQGRIGYFALRHVRQLNERIRFDAALDADFAGDDPFAELKLGLALRVTERMSLKLKYAERQTRRGSNPRNPLDSNSDRATSISLEVALF